MIRMRAQLEETVKKIRERFYAPHGASRTKKIEVIRQRLNAEKLATLPK